MSERIPEGQTVHQKYYEAVLMKLKKRYDLWKKDSWIRHQNNVPVHNALSV